MPAAVLLQYIVFVYVPSLSCPRLYLWVFWSGIASMLVCWLMLPPLIWQEALLFVVAISSIDLFVVYLGGNTTPIPRPAERSTSMSAVLFSVLHPALSSH